MLRKIRARLRRSPSREPVTAAEMDAHVRDNLPEAVPAKQPGVKKTRPVAPRAKPKPRPKPKPKPKPRAKK